MNKKLTPCVLCRKKHYKKLFTHGQRNVVQCIHDGLISVNPQLTKKEITTMYNDRYFEKNDEFSGATCIGHYAYIDEGPLLKNYFKRKLQLIQTVVPTGKLLEIGCGHGFFLSAAKKFPYEVEGIDISGYAIEYAKTLGVNARLTELEKAGYKNNSFDIVSAFQLLEHVSDPLAMLQETYRITKNKGMILLTTPNEGGYMRRLMGRWWLNFRHPEHLYFFSKKTISALLTKAGYSHITFYTDETRRFPIRHILGGLKYYLRGSFFRHVANIVGRLCERMHVLDVTLPIPLDTLVVTARKKY